MLAKKEQRQSDIIPSPRKYKDQNQYNQSTSNPNFKNQDYKPLGRDGFGEVFLVSDSKK